MDAKRPIGSGEVIFITDFQNTTGQQEKRIAVVLKIVHTELIVIPLTSQRVDVNHPKYSMRLSVSAKDESADVRATPTLKIDPSFLKLENICSFAQDKCA